ncbi:hypothetical protein CC86DRAFT_371511, partial [Ophiobolus disseminans]
MGPIITASDLDTLQTVQSRNPPNAALAQKFPGTNIDSRKLTALLRIKFGSGGYNIRILQNSFYITAPQELSTGEISMCRR